MKVIKEEHTNKLNKQLVVNEKLMKKHNKNDKSIKSS